MKLDIEIKQKIREAYESTPEYVHSVWLGRKYTNGQDTGRKCIVFCVDQKKPIDQVPPSELIPSEFTVGGIQVETDVQERQRIEFVGCYSLGDSSSGIPTDPEISRLQPAQSGMSMLNPMRGGQEIIQFPTGFSPSEGGNWYITLGTLGFFAIDNTDNKVVGVTNSHVAIHERIACSDRSEDSYNIADQIVWPPNGESYAPGMLSADGDQPLKLVCPKIKRYVPVSTNSKNYSDVALLHVNPSYLDANSYKIWAPTGQDPFVNFMPFATKSEIDALFLTNPRLFSTGRTTGPKGFTDSPSCRLRTLGVGVYAFINGPEGGTDWADTIAYEYEDESPYPVAGGDSGSALVALIDGVYKIVGIVFAGNNTFGLASRIDRVAQDMNIRAWDGTGSISEIGTAEKKTVSQYDERSSATSFECQGKIYWQAGFTTEFNPSPCPAPNVQTDRLCWDMKREQEGDYLGENFGWWTLAISRDGNSFAGMAPSSNDGPAYVRIYSKNETGWSQRGTSIIMPEQAQLGTISLNSDGVIIAIGSTHVSSSGIEQRGRTRVYQWNGSSWSQRGQDIFGDATGNWLGYSTSLSDDGNTLAVGAPKHTRVGHTNAGHVKVYDWNGSAWSQRGSNINGENQDYSGASVSISSDGNTLAIGSPSDATGYSNPGKVRIYKWSSSWSLEKTIQGTNDKDEFGGSVSISGDGNKVAIGARLNQANYPYVSKAWIDGSSAEGFKGLRIGEVQVHSTHAQGQIIGESIYGDDYLDDFGTSVSLNHDGSSLAVGAGQTSLERELNGMPRKGYVRVYDWGGTFWVPRGKIQPRNSNNALLRNVQISGDGNRIAVAGSFPPEGNSWGGKGKIQIYDWNCSELPRVDPSAQATQSKTGSLWAWGRNKKGALGIGLEYNAQSPYSYPVHPSPTLINPGRWKSVSAGDQDSHAIRFNDTRWAWGENGRPNLNYGTFGDGTTNDSYYPKQIGHDTWKMVDNSGGTYVHAIKSDGTLWGWGSNVTGNLGDGTVNDGRTTPTQVGQDDNWVAVSSIRHDQWKAVVGLKRVSEGLCSLWTWGGGDDTVARNVSYGEESGLGSPLDSAVDAKIPGRVGSNLLWKSVSAGLSKLIIGYDNKLWSWGKESSNLYGQVGIARLSPIRRPKILDSSEWIAISAGHEHYLAIKSDGTLWGWGDNTYGQVGLDPFENPYPYPTEPIQIGIQKWKAISAGWRHSLAIRMDGTLWAWGDNTYGQLGDGTTTSRSTPVQVGSLKWIAISAGWYHSLGILED